MYEDLRIINWPDPRLKRTGAAVSQFNASLRALADRMLQLMRENRGVGLAAQQVGLDLRLFVMNPTGKPGDDRVYVNPTILEEEGLEDGEEGCLSLPGIHISVPRSRKVALEALDVDGRTFQQQATGYVARIWQHEIDHLNGILLTDRMGYLARMACRRTLRELEEQYARGQGEGSGFRVQGSVSATGNRQLATGNS